jgi:hypothetical protein
MDAGVTTLPESLSYLPAFFRAEVEPSGVVAHHPIRWVLQVFETNLHLAERMIEASRMLFDPEEVSLFRGKVCSSTFSEEDIIDLRSFLSRLEEDYPGQVSDLLKQKKQWTQKDLDALIKLLNKVIQSKGIYVPVRFATVKFSDRTKALLKQQPQGEALVHLNRLLIEDAYPLEILAKPESSLLKFDNWEVSCLHWLASWVKIALDQQWLYDGSSLFSVGDFIDLPAFVAKLRTQDPISKYLWKQFSASTQEVLTSAASTPEEQKLALVQALDNILKGVLIYETVRFAGVALSPETLALRSQNPQGTDLIRLNRLLLEDAYPLEIAKSLYDANGRHEKALKVIKEAPQLYRLRGTRKGLTEILALLYDEDVEIFERSWPRGFEIGVSSAIGLDCWLIDEINLDFQFTVLIRSTERNRDLLLEVGSRIVSELAGSNEERQIAWISIDSAAQPVKKEHAERSTISRLRQLIDQEKPAHTCYYLALEPPKTPEKPQLPPLVIGVDSIVESFWID